MNKIFVISAIGLGVLLLYQNCTPNTASPPLSNQDGGARTFYLLEANYSCTSQTGPIITANYKDKIRINNDGFTRFGDPCNDALEQFSQNDSRFEIFDGGTRLRYNSQVYEWREQEP